MTSIVLPLKVTSASAWPPAASKDAPHTSANAACSSDRMALPPLVRFFPSDIGALAAPYYYLPAYNRPLALTLFSLRLSVPYFERAPMHPTASRPRVKGP